MLKAASINENYMLAMAPLKQSTAGIAPPELHRAAEPDRVTEAGFDFFLVNLKGNPSTRGLTAKGTR
ncbi:hypothetical protein HN018_03665 [Lichenicola cladoniae]|uniref:Uncharacterized protein n=1 Tax=Lichenicola cladoniae TaxID=1484109 RepID=A0A6M8HLN5_9PROT|nr:hypothetical protein [Lichenicola cladoniae]NPD70214.1 hypothetical protein [Acetobacteraceae bacterium]QKE89252.1 hypothetical protein HN018_03665 [Lichenicola cladoniae]